MVKITVSVYLGVPQCIVCKMSCAKAKLINTMFSIDNFSDQCSILKSFSYSPQASSGLLCCNSPTVCDISFQHSVLDFAKHLAHYQAII